MPITLTPYDGGELCYGYAWTVANEDLLADRIGSIALGQARHVQKILAGVSIGPPPTTAGAVESAIKLLTAPPGEDPWHRDGWMFQAMSWIAATKAAPTAVIRPPHMILAHKGFDGLQLKIDSATGTIAAAVIFEDKATENPRPTIRNDVWPEFEKLESGDRENVLMAEVVALLLTKPDVDPDIAIQNVIWKDARHYRVSITINEAHASEKGHKRLFKGYDEIVTGAKARRRGEVFQIDDLRGWMGQLSQKAIAAIEARAAAHV